MKHTILSITLCLTLFAACKKEKTQEPSPGDPPVDVHTILLKDMIVKNLPSPYYHFEYDNSSFITHVNVQSGYEIYDLLYSNGRISQMNDNTLVNKDKLQYVYDNGKVSKINYINQAGIIFKQNILTYNSAEQLTAVEWDFVNADETTAPERIIQFEYYSDGNLFKVNDHWFEIPGRQPETFTTDTYENYDTKTNVDAFAILYKTNDHLFLLPNIVIQKNNPLKETRSGDGLNYSINYTYTYNNDLPVKKDGDLLILNGESEGTHIDYLITFSYY
ncbi:hypothetical protein FRZ67_05400 [Panacibacter ginsenosidivorans]|uniref:DUF4595 domain-containing protein n=1 Tax=Panacibacter ginsenosidivorans TaxID=1813871 RepID=A0A5B8V7T3_9BACT|nr:hypothetical protein [Panacibacter ginsenosidivorans]QEC66766.1 hypothetical protein FRZ67_05400 [Panacibacter ginsenosidivorans]